MGRQTRRITLTRKGNILPRRTEDFDLQIVEEGEGEVIVDGCSYRLSRGETHIAYPGETIDIIPGRNEFIRWYIHFDSLCPDGNGLGIGRSPFFSNRVIPLADLDHALELCERMLREFTSQEPLWQARAGALLTELIVPLVRHQSVAGDLAAGDAVSRNLDGLRNAREYIRNHLGERLSLEGMAAVAELSPSHFARLFAAYTGHTPYDYLGRCRISHAKFLLARNEHPIKEIAVLAGYADVHHFTRAFRKHTGQTPGRYRAKR